MKHIITRFDDSIEIQVLGIGEDRRLFGGLHPCTRVEEPCGDRNYATLDSFTAQPLADGVRFELRARANTKLDLDEAEECLDNAMGRILERRENEGTTA